MYEVSRLFSMDPTNLKRLPLSEYRKRRDYWLMWRKSQGQDYSVGEEIAPGVTSEEINPLPPGAVINE